MWKSREQLQNMVFRLSVHQMCDNLLSETLFVRAVATMSGLKASIPGTTEHKVAKEEKSLQKDEKNMQKNADQLNKAAAKHEAKDEKKLDKQNEKLHKQEKKTADAAQKVAEH